MLDEAARISPAEGKQYSWAQTAVICFSYFFSFHFCNGARK